MHSRVCGLVHQCLHTPQSPLSPHNCLCTSLPTRGRFHGPSYPNPLSSIPFTDSTTLETASGPPVMQHPDAAHMGQTHLAATSTAVRISPHPDTHRPILDAASRRQLLRSQEPKQGEHSHKKFANPGVQAADRLAMACCKSPGTNSKTATAQQPKRPRDKAPHPDPVPLAQPLPEQIQDTQQHIP